MCDVLNVLINLVYRNKQLILQVYLFAKYQETNLLLCIVIMIRQESNCEGMN